MSDRYTRDGSDALEQRLHDVCQQIGRETRAIVPAAKLQALILGGGYGRGEGGVLRTESGDAPYNDLEFFVLIAGPVPLSDRQYGPAFHALGHRMTEVLGIEVEFKILSLERLRDSGTTMFYYDLVRGHRVTTGPADILKSCAHHTDATRIPLAEAARLLLNRCTGLLFAAERLTRDPFTTEDADFTSRNIAKASLALGDVILAASGSYHWSCLQRHQHLLALDVPALPMAAIRAAHAAGVEFKLHPAASTETRDALAARHREIKDLAWSVWSWLEEKRLGLPSTDPVSLATSPRSKCPETNPLKNALLRLRTFGPGGLLSTSLFRYPREVLFSTLPILLWAPDQAPATAAHLSAQLRTPVTTWTDALPAYTRLWSRFN